MSRARNPFTKSLDLAQNKIRVRPPHERLGIAIALVKIIEHGFLQRSHRSVAPAAHTSLGDFGKQAFYGQIDRPLSAAYDVASEAMACNLLLQDAAEGMDAFLQKRPANWRGK